MHGGARIGILFSIWATLAGPVVGQQQPQQCLPNQFPIIATASSEEPPLAGAEEPRRPEPTPRIDPRVEPRVDPRVVPAAGLSEPEVPGRVVLPPTPVVRIHVRAPAVAASGGELQYRIELENPTRATAHKVRVRADKPNLSTVTATEPPAVEQSDQELVWELGDMPANSRREIRVVVRPNPEAGQIKMCARVAFEHGQCVETRITRPAVVLDKEVPSEAILYEPAACKIMVRNNGKVPVRDLQLAESLAVGLDFEQLLTPETPAQRGTTAPVPFVTSEDGRVRTWTVGTLEPGQSRQVEYRLLPKQTGTLVATTVLTADQVRQERASTVKVLEPMLAIQITGPKQGHVDQPTEYQIRVSNSGTAPLSNVRVSAALPPGARPVKTSAGGQLFGGEVQWIVTRLEPGETKPLNLGVKVSQPGTRPIAVSVRADRGLEQRSQIETEFLGVASLDWSAVGTPGSAKVGDPVRYVVEVVNVGTAPATNVVLIANWPNSMKFVSADSEPKSAAPAASEGSVTFPPRTIAVGAKAVYVLQAEALRADQAKFRFELKADHLDVNQPPLSKEPATTVGGT